MNLYLQHVNILTPDIGGTITFYQEKLGMKLAARFYQEGIFDIAFLRDGSASTHFAIELVGPPFIGWMEDTYQKHGPIMDHFNFVVDDVDTWYQKLKVSKTEFVQQPEHFLGVKEMYFRDPCGVITEMMALDDPRLMPALSPESPDGKNIEYRLHHISILCNDIPAVERFYVEELGLHTVLEAREDGYIFLIDPLVLADETMTAPSLEIMGPPGIEPREAAYLAKYGPGIDHLCFVVDDVDAAFEELSAKGIQFDLEPMEYAGSKIAYFKDPNGIDIELMLPIPREHFIS
ncbi:MAG: VOC family protein [Anaerolineales bacterium]|nr:VOC family protein [Anaerolineales bacterium]